MDSCTIFFCKPHHLGGKDMGTGDWRTKVEEMTFEFIYLYFFQEPSISAKDMDRGLDLGCRGESQAPCFHISDGMTNGRKPKRHSFASQSDSLSTPTVFSKYHPLKRFLHQFLLIRGKLLVGLLRPKACKTSFDLTQSERRFATAEGHKEHEIRAKMWIPCASASQLSWQRARRAAYQ